MRKILHLGLTQTNYFPEDEVIHLPIIELKQNIFSSEVIDTFKMFDYVIVTSKSTVRFFVKPHQINLKRSVEYISIGEKTSDALKKMGVYPSYQATDSSQEGLVDLLDKLQIQNKKILLPRSNLGRNKVDQFLNEKKIPFLVIHPYETQLSKNFQKISLDHFHAIFFSSSSCIHFFFKVYLMIPSDITIIVMGKPTMNTLNGYNKQYLNKVELVLN